MKSPTEMRLIEHDSPQFGAWPPKNATEISGYLFDHQQAAVLIEPQQQPKWSQIHWVSKLAALDLTLLSIRNPYRILGLLQSWEFIRPRPL